MSGTGTQRGSTRSRSIAVLGAAAAVVGLSIASYLYASLPLPPPRSDSERKRNRLPLSLSMSFIPSTAILAHLTRHYSLHLILPSALESQPPISGTHLIHHSTREGKLHIGRALAASFILVLSEPSSSDLKEATDEERRERWQEQEMECVKFIDDIKSFVREIIILDLTARRETSGGTITIETEVRKHGARWVRDWQELNHVLGI